MRYYNYIWFVSRFKIENSILNHSGSYKLYKQTIDPTRMHSPTHHITCFTSTCTVLLIFIKVEFLILTKIRRTFDASSLRAEIKKKKIANLVYQTGRHGHRSTYDNYSRRTRTSRRRVDIYFNIYLCTHYIIIIIYVPMRDVCTRVLRLDL